MRAENEKLECDAQEKLKIVHYTVLWQRLAESKCRSGEEAGRFYSVLEVEGVPRPDRSSKA